MDDFELGEEEEEEDLPVSRITFVAYYYYYSIFIDIE
jgi:hypothetical protein